MIISGADYKRYLSAGSVPPAEPHTPNTTTHYCFGPLLGIKAGVVESAIQVVGTSDTPASLARLKLTYTYGALDVGTVVYATVHNDCPAALLVR
jgi:hypothetical protein